MGTSRSFSALLNDYLAYDMLAEDYIKKDYMMTQLKQRGLIKTGWKSGSLKVPFKSSVATSVSFGSLTAEDDIDEFGYTVGSIDDYKEVWGTMFWHSRDLREHNGKVPEDSFLKNLPDQVDEFTSFIKQNVSTMWLNGAHFAKLTADTSAADGIITVDHPERFQIGQKVKIVDANSDITGYVKTININTNEVLLVTARGGSTALDFQSGEALSAASAKCYVAGADSAAFSSLPSLLLSSANGGSSTIYGVTKTVSPYTQAVNIDGTAIDASNILTKLFDAQTTGRQIGKGNPTHWLMSFKDLGSCMKVLESGSGGFRHVNTKANPFGYTEIEISGVKGGMTLVGINEKNDDTIIGIDWNSLKFHTNDMFKKETDPDGNQYYKLRATTGYKYIVDISMYGELVVHKPSHNVIIHTVAY